MFECSGSYAAESAPTENVQYAHSLGDVVTAAVAAGLAIVRLDEHLDAPADKPVRVWNRETGHLATTLHGHTGRVRSVAISPDGTWLASGSDDETVQVRDRRSAQCVAAIPTTGPPHKLEWGEILTAAGLSGLHGYRFVESLPPTFPHPRT